MSSPDVTQLVYGPVTCHAFNKDKTQVAVCPNNNEVVIYSKQGGTWVQDQVLDEHDKLVTSIDWAPESNRLVTSSQDRNAYVWTQDPANKSWKPTLVLLRINRAATFVKWSPKEDKFAVASGARCISVCYFEEENDWWVSKHIKKPLKSTVLSLDWHPENVLLAAGSSDNKARVFSAFVKGLDDKPAPSIWGEKFPFGTVCAEWSSAGWVHAVAFSPSGKSLAWTGHDAAVTIASPGPQGSVFTINSANLPFTCMSFLNESSIVAAGHDCVPFVFAEKAGKWNQGEKVDQGTKAKAATSGASVALNKFKQMDTKAQSSPSDTSLTTIHQNTIKLRAGCLRPFTGQPSKVTAFSTSGIDGKLVLWTV